MHQSRLLSWLVAAMLLLHGPAAPGGGRPAESAPAPTGHSAALALDQRLLESAQAGDTTEVARLLAAGAHTTVRDSAGRTPLMLATTMGHEVLERLVQEGLGARVVIEGLPAPPVSEARLRCVELLLEHGADPHAQDNDRATALHLAVARNYADIVARLLESGAPPDARYASGLPIASLSAARGFVATLGVLLDAGASAQLATDRGKMPLHYAAEAGQRDAVRLLLSRGVDVDALTKQKWTALHLAAARGHPDTVALLLEHGADAKRRTARRMTAEQLARARGHTTTADVLRGT